MGGREEQADNVLLVPRSSPPKSKDVELWLTERQRAPPTSTTSCITSYGGAPITSSARSASSKPSVFPATSLKAASAPRPAGELASRTEPSGKRSQRVNPSPPPSGHQCSASCTASACGKPFCELDAPHEITSAWIAPDQSSTLVGEQLPEHYPYISADESASHDEGRQKQMMCVQESQQAFPDNTIERTAQTRHEALDSSNATRHPSWSSFQMESSQGLHIPEGAHLVLTNDDLKESVVLLRKAPALAADILYETAEGEAFSGLQGEANASDVAVAILMLPLAQSNTGSDGDLFLFPLCESTNSFPHLDCSDMSYPALTSALPDVLFYRPAHSPLVVFRETLFQRLARAGVLMSAKRQKRPPILCLSTLLQHRKLNSFPDSSLSIETVTMQATGRFVDSSTDYDQLERARRDLQLLARTADHVCSSLLNESARSAVLQEMKVISHAIQS